jgi:hypothetical protein
MVFGLHRQGGRLKRPVASITLEQPVPQTGGAYDSDYLQWVGKRHDGNSVQRMNWQANVRVDRAAAASTFVLSHGVDERAPTAKLQITDGGDVELPNNGGAIILRSPSGKRWRVTVDDQGKLETAPAGQ